MRKVGVEEWIVRLVQAMYNNARSRVRVGSEYSEEFEVGVGVHQGSVLSPLLFIIVLEDLSRDFRVGCPGSCSLQMISISPEGYEEWHPHNWPVTTTNHHPPHRANYLGHQRVPVFV